MVDAAEVAIGKFDQFERVALRIADFVGGRATRACRKALGTGAADRGGRGGDNGGSGLGVDDG